LTKPTTDHKRRRALRVGSNSLQPAITFTITIERVDAALDHVDVALYHVWLGLCDDGDFDETPFSFIAGTFPTFDAATAACLAAFPGREILAALEPRPTCPHCHGRGYLPIESSGPYGVRTLECAACQGTGNAPRTMQPVTR